MADFNRLANKLMTNRTWKTGAIKDESRQAIVEFQEALPASVSAVEGRHA